MRRPANRRVNRSLGHADDWLIAIGGVLAIGLSVGLFVWLVARPDTSVNPLALATLLLASAAGALAILYQRRPLALAAANILLLLAIAPTVFGSVWLMYTPPLILLLVGSCWKTARSVWRRMR